MKIKLLLAILLISTTAKASVVIEQSCTGSAVGPVSSISCTLPNPVEAHRLFWVTFHYLLSPGGYTTFAYNFAPCTGFTCPANSFAELDSTGNDIWIYAIPFTTKNLCYTTVPDRTFTINFTGIIGTITDVQLYVAQVQGLNAPGSGEFTDTAQCPVNCPSGTGGTPSFTLFSPDPPGVTAGEWVAAWVSTNRAPTALTAGAGYTLADATVPDTHEWQIAGSSSSTFPVTFTGTAAGYWKILVWSLHSTGSPDDSPSYCSALTSIIHRRQIY